MGNSQANQFNELIIFQSKEIHRIWQEDGGELSTVCRQLKLKAPDGKKRATDYTNTEGALRIIHSSPIWVQLKSEARDLKMSHSRGIANA